MVGYGRTGFLFCGHNEQTMRRKKQSSKKPAAALPAMPWQTGTYSRKMDFHTVLPYGFLLLCKLWDTTPETVLDDFMQNVSPPFLAGVPTGHS